MMEKGRLQSVDRMMGAIIGALVGDGLGLGCHWYYDLEALKRDYGPWISDYVQSKPDRKDMMGGIAKFRYQTGLTAGDVSQTGQITILLLESVVETGDYDQSDFTSHLDSLLSALDGTPFSGHYTDWAMRDVWKQRDMGLDWDEVGSRADTSEAAMRSTVLTARFSADPERLVETAYPNILLTHREPYIAAQSLSFALTLGALIKDTPLSNIGQYLGTLANKPSIQSKVPSFDCLTQVKNGDMAVKHLPQVEPASRICSVYGLACTLGFMLPAAYYFIHRYPNDFEKAVLSAVNGGGNNMARAALTGALSGAMVGLKGIPEKFIQGLKDSDRLLNLADRLSTVAASSTNGSLLKYH
jgi:ADP-ribosylglycohydrolase